MSILKVNCPRCHKTINWNADYPYKPFCSERCKNIDLGAWADEAYAIPDINTPLPHDPKDDEES